jgi:hypothetical protein
LFVSNLGLINGRTEAIPLTARKIRRNLAGNPAAKWQQCVIVPAAELIPNMSLFGYRFGRFCGIFEGNKKDSKLGPFGQGAPECFLNVIGP